MTEKFGMMNSFFFVDKNEILKWINSTFKLQLKKIEHACTGALYCQIFDAIHPGKVKMRNVNWKAKLEHEFLANYKILQKAFDNCQITKNIEVEKLSKGKYQDNLEFLQWCKGYFDFKNPNMSDYDPEKRRNGSELDYANENNMNATNMKKRGDSKNQNEFKATGVGLKPSGNSKSNLSIVNKKVITGSKGKFILIIF
jgi:hypothetical protein